MCFCFPGREPEPGQRVGEMNTPPKRTQDRKTNLLVFMSLVGAQKDSVVRRIIPSKGVLAHVTCLTVSSQCAFKSNHGTSIQTGVRDIILWMRSCSLFPSSLNRQNSFHINPKSVSGKQASRAAGHQVICQLSTNQIAR